MPLFMFTRTLLIGLLLSALAGCVHAVPEHEVVHSAAVMARDAVSSVEPGLFGEGIFTASNGIRLPYRVLTPMNPQAGVHYPLVLQLHGSGGIGTDNALQLDRLARSWAMPAIRAKYQAYVLVPQFPVRSANYGAASPDQFATHSAVLIAALELTEKFVQENQVDNHRIYALGFSMGGSATWLAPTLRPNMFAAIMPISGIAPANASATGLLQLPIWVVHGNADDENPIVADLRLTRALREGGGKRIYFREYAGLAHELHADMYPGYWWRDWLFRQRRQ